MRLSHLALAAVLVVLIPASAQAAEAAPQAPVLDLAELLANPEPVEMAGKQCGPVTCAQGERCCNAECGICAPAGGPCPLIGCVPFTGSGGDLAVLLASAPEPLQGCGESR